MAQIGAVVGRAFSYDVLAKVSLQPEVQLRASLEELVRSQLVFRRGTPPAAIYSFKHALVQDAAYESLLKSRRHQLHAQIAAVLEECFPETIANEPEVLAHHLSQAGLHGNAVEYWRKAGEIAARRSANVEAIAHFSKALEALATPPDSRARSEQELALQVALAVPLVATKGHSAIEVERAYSRAQALCEGLGKLNSFSLFCAVYGITVWLVASSNERTNLPFASLRWPRMKGRFSVSRPPSPRQYAILSWSFRRGSGRNGSGHRNR